MSVRYNDPVITGQGMAEAQARLDAEAEADPQFGPMAKAHAITPAEQANIDAARAGVAEAEEAVNAAGIALSRARTGMESTPMYDKSRPRSFFMKRPETYRAAAAALPDLSADLAEARMTLQNATRRLNAIVRDVGAARAQRRQAAKLQHAPKAEPVQSRNRWYSTAMNRWGGKDAA